MFLYIIGGLAGMLSGAGYLVFFLRRLLTKILKLNMSTMLWIVIIIIALALALPAINFFSVYAVGYYYFLAVSLLLELLGLVIKSPWYQKLAYTGLMALVIVAVAIGLGIYNMKNVVETDYTLSSDKISHLKILQISDLHMGTIVHQQELARYVKHMNALHPDLVVLTGDIFDESTSLADMKAACKDLGSLSQTKGIYFIYGNHDTNTYTKTPHYSQEIMKEEIEKNGITILADETKTMGSLTIVGRKDRGFANENNRKSIKDLLQGVPQSNYILVLDHQPVEYKDNANAGVDLQLSGHTHGGQIWPTGQLNELITGGLRYGEKSINDFHIITSSGIAGWGYPIKIGAVSEYVLITIN